MRTITTIASLAALSSLSGCYKPTEWNPGIATPTATALHHERERAKVNPVGAGAIVAAGLGLAAAGYTADGPPPRPVVPPSNNDPTAPVRGVETPSAPRAEIDPESAQRGCMLAIEQEARRNHPNTRIDRLDSVEPLGGGLLVRGTVRLDERTLRPFRCRVDAQAVRMAVIDPAETRPPR